MEAGVGEQATASAGGGDARIQQALEQMEKQKTVVQVNLGGVLGGASTSKRNNGGSGVRFDSSAGGGEQQQQPTPSSDNNDGNASDLKPMLTALMNRMGALESKMDTIVREVRGATVPSTSAAPSLRSISNRR